MTHRILFLTVGPRQRASARYRVMQFIPGLENLGFETRILTPAKKPHSTWQRLAARNAEDREILRHAEWADIVFIQKRLFHTSLLRRLKEGGRILVFDLDDSITTTHNNHWSRFTEWKIQQRFKAVCQLADLIIAGNAYLAGLADRHAPRVEILPTVVDLSRYSIKTHGQSPRLVLGWIGQPSSLEYLESLTPILRRLCDRHPNLWLHVICKGQANLPGVRVQYFDWSEEREVKDLLDIDIGLMPLPDDEWIKGKCALKAIQYMAAGLPVVCSNVGANPEVVRHNIDGLLVNADKQEWEDAITRLITEPALRTRMGQSGRERTESRYSLSHATERLASWLEALQTTRETHA